MDGETKPVAKPNPQPAKKAKPAKDAIFFFCQKPGHWKRNCKLYMEDLKKQKKGDEASTSGIFVTKVLFLLNHLSIRYNTWFSHLMCRVLETVESWTEAR